MGTTLSRLRIIGDIEGVSYLLLLGVAMPLKYMAGIPAAVTLAGGIHGALFVAFCAALLQVHVLRQWTLRKSALAFLSSLVPGGTFLLSRKLRQEEQKEERIPNNHSSPTH